MNKIIDITATSLFSPLCQTLINETSIEQRCELINIGIASELLIIRLDGVVIGYTTFTVVDNLDIEINNIYIRSIIKDQTLAEYWLSRHLKRFLRNNTYHNVRLAS
ncbi:hypothetical protein [Psychromonas sp. MME2]|uniref:hypothetical protein n=1 Tax=unclassified Psychromonas TaxID=2614957 RepID=UPI00339BEC03